MRPYEVGNFCRDRELWPISAFNTQLPFEVTTSGDRVLMARDSKTLASIPAIDFSHYIQSQRKQELGNSWRSEVDRVDAEAFQLALDEEVRKSGAVSAFWGGMFGQSKNAMELKEIRLASPLDINVAEIARHFPEYFYRKPYEKFSGGMDNSELIREEGGVGQKKYILLFDDKTEGGFTKISTHYTPSELADLLKRLPEPLATPLKDALVSANFLSPSSLTRK